MSTTKYVKVAQLKSIERLQQRLSELGVTLPCDDRVLSASEGFTACTVDSSGLKNPSGIVGVFIPWRAGMRNTDGTPTN